jgi:hypothetical protein
MRNSGNRGRPFSKRGGSRTGRSARICSRACARISRTQIVELTAAVALENFRSKFNVALGIEVQGFCLLVQYA